MKASIHNVLAKGTTTKKINKNIYKKDKYEQTISIKGTQEEREIISSSIITNQKSLRLFKSGNNIFK